MKIDLRDKVFLQELRDQALSMAAIPDQSCMWREAYEEIASSADRLHAMLSRAELSSFDEERR